MGFPESSPHTCGGASPRPKCDYGRIETDCPGNRMIVVNMVVDAAVIAVVVSFVISFLLLLFAVVFFEGIN